MPSFRVGMIFGGRSVEHEVSILTAHQAIAALPRDRYEPVPIYIAKSGQWYSGDALLDLRNFADLEKLTATAEPVVFSADPTRPGLLRLATSTSKWPMGRRAEPWTLDPIDVAFPLIHGSHGEDGTLQGLLELADIAYVGSGVSASAVGMDKVLSKTVLRAAGVPVVDEYALSRLDWNEHQDGVTEAIEARFAYPVYVKPVSLGSSIGVARASDRAELIDAITVAATYDVRIMVEPAQLNIVEINCSVLGNGADARASVCERPINEGLLSYEDKYLSGGKGQGMESARREIPAALAPELTSAIQETAVRAFAAIGAAGVARIDFLLHRDDGRFYVNEINTMPGSLSFYLWEPLGVPFDQLLDTLIALARTRQREKRRTTYTFSTWLLQRNPLMGAKASGGVKLPAQQVSPPQEPTVLLKQES
jgi:D-alanine-D-alanine ligase